MGFFVVLLGLLLPRIVLLVACLVGAFSSTGWGIIGWFFMPYTTLAATVAYTNGLEQNWTIAVIVIGVVIDIGAWSCKTED